VRVELSDEARSQVKSIDEWWRRNRPAAPDLFTLELEHALTRLERTPTLGTPYETEARVLRRLLLRRTHYHLYFVEREGALFVLAVWSAFRGRGPKV
jgi:plasmid stabilization system protein ParE